MDVFYEKLSNEAEFCINYLNVECSYLDVPWHFHPETEIIHIEKGSGFRFVGDHSEAFAEGDIGLVGSNLPHVWKSDSIYKENIPDLKTRLQVIHFHDTLFKGPLTILPEMQGINQLLYESQFGLKFFGSARDHIAQQMQALTQTSGIEKLVHLIRILDYMSKCSEKKQLASIGYSKIRKSANFERYDKAHRYMIDNFKTNIKLETVADIIGMTPTSFCRYFKKHTSKSFHTVLNEIRVGHACKLLIENKMNIAGISIESGFSNISNFNEQFKKIKGVSPSLFKAMRRELS